MRTALIALACVGCAADAYSTELEALPAVHLDHGADAVVLVERELGLSPGTLEVTWIVGDLRSQDGEPVAGVTIGCRIWVRWWSASWTSGTSADGPAISGTALAHEALHCSLAGDAGHADPRWSQDVSRVNAALRAAGF